MPDTKLHIIIDGFALVRRHKSGVSHYIDGLINELDRLAASGKLDYSIVVPRSKQQELRQLYHLKHVKKIIANPLDMRIFRRLVRYGLFPPVDWFFGVGNYFFPDFIIWPLTRRSTATVLVHDTGFLDTPQFLLPANLAYLRRVVPTAVRRADSITANSQFTKDSLLRHFPNLDSEMIGIAPPSCDKHVFYPRQRKDITPILKKYGIPDQPYIMSLGNLEPRKNHEALIAAYLSLPDKLRRKYNLVITGAEGWNNQSLMSLIRQTQARGEGLYIPNQYVIDEDRPALFSGCSLFALFSHYEGFGMQVLEAVASGAQALVSDIPPFREAAGSFATYVDRFDQSAINQQLHHLLQHPSPPADKEVLAKHVDQFSVANGTQAVVDTIALAKNYRKGQVRR